MDKKGISYVDWAISLGIFLVFTLTIFVLFKPHVIEDYSTEYLISIAEQGIRENSSYEINNYPLFVDPDVRVVDDWIVIELGGDYSDLFGDGVRVYDADLGLVDYDLDGISLSLQSNFNLEPDYGSYEFSVLVSDIDGFAVTQVGAGLETVVCGEEDAASCTFGVVERIKGLDVS